MKRKRKSVVGPLLVWDAAWKIAAIRRAWRRRELGLAVGLLVANSAGILPMVYLWRTRGPESRPHLSEN